MRVPAFRDFYYKPFMVMREADAEVVRQEYGSARTSESYSWVMGMEWREDLGEAGWRVLVYAAESGRCFWERVPVIASEKMSYERADAKLEELRQKAMQGLLMESGRSDGIR